MRGRIAMLRRRSPSTFVESVSPEKMIVAVLASLSNLPAAVSQKIFETPEPKREKSPENHVLPTLGTD